MTLNLSQHILLDVLPENKRTLFFILLLAGQFTFLGSIEAGETDFKTYRKAAEQEINRQNAIVEEDPLDFLSYYELGHAYLALGRHEEEVQAYKETLRLNPKFAQAHYNLSMAFDYLNEGGKAIYHMQKALDIYTTKRDHRKIRTTQRQLKRFYMGYPSEVGTASSEKALKR
ncbi:MAG: tetratricopeptide (TPR) repeat protein [Nitrospinales bacterium]|jgi:tetratricopeptide (TPR) repeat protein